jgi:hypothetical protein
MNRHPYLGKKKHSHTESRRLGEEEMIENEAGGIVVDCAVKMHMRLGPALLKSVYEAVLFYELQNQSLLLNFGEAPDDRPLHFNSKSSP